MIEITEQEYEYLIESLDVTAELGIITEWGAVGADRPLVVILGEGHLSGKIFLATQDDLDRSDVFVRVKDIENILPLPNFDDVFELKNLSNE
ncbi:hypothetical protein HYS50_03410 [Candidatus Woesearchaeota archaeon]|nr:hypothetical protein [Candidatus Woesearchaeota archaeon]